MYEKKSTPHARTASMEGGSPLKNMGHKWTPRKKESQDKEERPGKKEHLSQVIQLEVTGIILGEVSLAISGRKG